MMVRINTNMQVAGAATTDRSGALTHATISAAHEAARQLGFGIGAKLRIRSTGLDAKQTGWNDIRTAGMKPTGDRSPLVVKDQYGVDSYRAIGEVELVLRAPDDDNINKDEFLAANGVSALPESTVLPEEKVEVSSVSATQAVDDAPESDTPADTSDSGSDSE